MNLVKLWAVLKSLANVGDSLEEITEIHKKVDALLLANTGPEEQDKFAWVCGHRGIEKFNFVPLVWGGKNYRIYGGPYRQRPTVLAGVKMAAEIHNPCSVDIPTNDFDVPSFPVMEAGLIKASLLLRATGAIYVGCMGGIGRTGLFMALMIRLFEDPLSSVPLVAIEKVRELYDSRAIETGQQERYVKEFDLSDIRYLLGHIEAF